MELQSVPALAPIALLLLAGWYAYRLGVSTVEEPKLALMTSLLRRLSE